MTPIGWIVAATCAMVAALVSWTLTEAQARRRLARRVAMMEERTDRNRADAQVRGEADRRALDTATREVEAARIARDRDASVYRAELAAAVADRQAIERRLAEAEAAAQRRITELEATRRRGTVEAVAREQQLTAALDHAQRRTRVLATVCRVETGAHAPLFRDRPAPVELEAIAARVRGLAFVDAIAIGDGDGLPLDRAGTRDADDLAALVPPVGRVATELSSILGPAISMVIYTTDARVVELRALPSWTGGAWLVAQASAQRPQAAALDAAVAYASVVRDGEADPPATQTLRLGARGRLGPGGARTEALGDELERATRGLGARLVALALGDQILAGVQADGIPADKLEPLLRGLQHLRLVAEARLRADGIARVEIDLAGATRLSLSTLGSGSRLTLATLTIGRPLDPLEVERVVGRLRRFLDAGGPLAAGDGAYA